MSTTDQSYVEHVWSSWTKLVDERLAGLDQKATGYRNEAILQIATLKERIEALEAAAPKPAPAIDDYHDPEKVKRWYFGTAAPAQDTPQTKSYADPNAMPATAPDTGARDQCDTMPVPEHPRDKTTLRDTPWGQFCSECGQSPAWCPGHNAHQKPEAEKAKEPKPITRDDFDTLYTAVHDFMRRFEMWVHTGKLLNYGYVHDDDPRYATRTDVRDIKNRINALREHLHGVVLTSKGAGSEKLNMISDALSKLSDRCDASEAQIVAALKIAQMARDEVDRLKEANR